jgi:hypothetical protein
MKLTLPRPPTAYDPGDQAQLRGALERGLGRVLEAGKDCEIGQGRVILTAPGGARFALAVDDAGALSAIPL